MLIFLSGAGALAFYQVKAMDDQLEDTTQAIDQMDGKVKRAEYEKSKFFAIARDVLNLAPKDPNAEPIVVDFKLQQLQTEEPELLAQSTSPDAAATNAAPGQPTEATNSVPAEPSQATNAAPLNSSSPTAK
jgi:hypothetical protein